MQGPFVQLDKVVSLDLAPSALLLLKAVPVLAQQLLPIKHVSCMVSFLFTVWCCFCLKQLI